MTVNCSRRDVGTLFIACVLFVSYYAFYHDTCQSTGEKNMEPGLSFSKYISDETESIILNRSERYIDCLGERKIVDVLRIGFGDGAILTEFPPLERIDILVKNAFDRLTLVKAKTFCSTASNILKEKSYWSLAVTERWKLALRIFATVGIKQRLHDVIGIGVKKSGSSALRSFLMHHPYIRVPDIYEPHYFDWRYFLENKQSYMAMMPLLAEDEICYEKTPRYFVTKTAPSNIARDICPKTKFVICIRDPVERALSDWHHEQNLLVERKNFSCAGCTAESEGVRFSKDILTTSGEIDRQSEFIDTSNYARHFGEWLKVFPLSKFLIIKEGDIRNDPFSVLRTLEYFLGVPRYYKQDMFVYNSSIDAMCFSRPRDKGTRCVQLHSPNGVPYPQPNRTVIKKMREFFRPQNKRFEEMTGIKFEWTDL